MSAPQWSIFFDPQEKRPRTPHTQCPHCKALDTIHERDVAIRWNSLQLSSNGATAVASTGQSDFESDGWICAACFSTEMDAPEGFEILDWY